MKVKCINAVGTSSLEKGKEYFVKCNGKSTYILEGVSDTVRWLKWRFEVVDNANPIITQAHTEEPVEFPLFTWEKWDVIEEGVYVYSPVTLKVDVGVHEFSHVMPAFTAGKKFAHATVDYQKSIITFYDTNEDEVGHKYALHLAIGEKIS